MSKKYASTSCAASSSPRSHSRGHPVHDLIREEIRDSVIHVTVGPEGGSVLVTNRVLATVMTFLLAYKAYLTRAEESIRQSSGAYPEWSSTSERSRARALERAVLVPCMEVALIELRRASVTRQEKSREEESNQFRPAIIGYTKIA